jgi:hypothetical protein
MLASVDIGVVRLAAIEHGRLISKVLVVITEIGAA